MNHALIEAVKRISIPELTIRSILADYEDLLDKKGGGAREQWDSRYSELDFPEKVLVHTHAAMVACTMMMSLETEVDFAELASQAFPSPEGDKEIIALRNELVSRGLSMSKTVPAGAGLTLDLVRERQNFFASMGNPAANTPEEE